MISPEMIYDLSNYSQWLGSFIIMIIVLTSFRLYDRRIRALGLMGLVSVVFQGLQTISIQFLHARYLNDIGDCYVFLETLLFLGFYYSQFSRNLYLRYALISSAIVTIAIYSLVLFGESTYPWYAVLSSIRNLIMIYFSVVTFFNTYSN